MIREKLSGDLKQAITAKETQRVSTLRLICAALKDREIVQRTDESTDGVSDVEVLGILVKMIKQREESAHIYEEAGRLDLAEQERGEIDIIRAYLPRQMSDSEVRNAIASAIKDTGAASIRDLGKVMAHLKSQHTGKMDFAQACASLKDCFG